MGYAATCKGFHFFQGNKTMETMRERLRLTGVAKTFELYPNRISPRMYIPATERRLPRKANRYATAGSLDWRWHTHPLKPQFPRLVNGNGGRKGGDEILKGANSPPLEFRGGLFKFGDRDNDTGVFQWPGTIPPRFWGWTASYRGLSALR